VENSNAVASDEGKGPSLVMSDVVGKSDAEREKEDWEKIGRIQTMVTLKKVFSPVIYQSKSIG
jgi:hypothetical protein